MTFIALDVAQGDLGEDYTVPSNVYCAVYQEELCGYMAGYAAVKLGYTHWQCWAACRSRRAAVLAMA